MDWKKSSGFADLKLISGFVAKLIAGTSADDLLQKRLILPFYPETDECPACGYRLHVQKARTKTVVTMDIGAFSAKETVMFCPNDQTIFTSAQLRSLVPGQGTFGFDVIVEVGLALYVRCRNNQETMKEIVPIMPIRLLHKNFFEQKIDPDSQSLDEIMASFKSGVWQTSSLELIPLITTYALIHWVFEYLRQSSGYGFPFDRPCLDFYRRLQKAHQVLGEIMDVHLRDQIKDNKPFFQIYRKFRKTVEDK